MLSLFPQLLFLAPISATIIRLTLAVAFFIVAYAQYKKREALSPLFVYGSIAFHVALAAFLLVGLYTQLVALVAGLGTFAGMFARGEMARYTVYPRTVLILLTVMCVSLVFTGAGAFAFDLPL